MKKWFKYLFVFYILLCSTGFAMAQYVTIGANNGTTAWLMRTFSEDGKSQLTFSNTDLTSVTPALNVGDTIYSIGWNVESLGSAGGQVMYNANISIRESGAVVLVWSGTLAPTLGWNDILLDVPHVRTGTGPLIVEYCFDNCEGTSTADVYRTQTLTNTFRYKTGNNANGCSYNNPWQDNTVNRPNTRFGKSVPGATYTHDTICSGTSIPLSSTSSLTLNTSISGFTYHGIWIGHYYYTSTTSKPWLAADLHCQSVGGHLVHILDNNENNHVQGLTSGNRWIGYYQNCNPPPTEPAGGFEWTDGTIGYTNWDAGQPNNGTAIGEEYTVMYSSGVWHDYNATTSFNYVMEIEENYLWNTGETTSSITVSPTITTTYWVDYSLGTQTTREYFTVEIGSEGCTDSTATNYDPNAVCDDGSCTSPPPCILAINHSQTIHVLCPGDSTGSAALLNTTTYLDFSWYLAGSIPGTPINMQTSISGLSAGTWVVQGSNGTGCLPATMTDTVVISEGPAMSLQTTVVDSTCGSSYAFVSASVSSSSGGNVSSLTYCASSSGSFDYNNIELVRLVGDGDSIVNNTVNYAGPGPLGCDDYEDYTSQYTTLTPGQSYSVEVNTSYCSSTSLGGDSIKVFIDWNIDGDFDDPGEVVGASFSSSTISFIVPNNGFYGATRMRVVSQTQMNNPLYPNGVVGACDVGALTLPFPHPWYGATEDYTIIVNGSVAYPVSYLWSNGATTDSIFGLSAGAYTVEAIDANGCKAHDTAIVSLNGISASVIITDSILCYGDLATIDVITSGGIGWYLYQLNYWTPFWGGIWLPFSQQTTYDTATFSSVPANTYQINVSDTNQACSSQISIVITQPNPLSSNTTPTLQRICQNALSSNLTIIANGGIAPYQYQWHEYSSPNQASSAVIIPNETDSFLLPPTNIVGITYYYCTVIDANGCDDTSSIVTVETVLAPIFTLQPQDSAVCMGSNLTINVADTFFVTSGGTNAIIPIYQWYENSICDTSTSGGGVPATGPGNNTNTYTPQTTTTGTTYYYCTVVIPQIVGCNTIISECAEIIVNPPPSTVTLSAVPNPACLGDDISLTAVASTGFPCVTSCHEVEVIINTDANGSEISWDITDNTGVILASGGPYANGVNTYTSIACLPSGAQLDFNWYDSQGDGWNDGINQGLFSVIQGTATLTQGSPSSGSSGSATFSITSSTSPCTSSSSPSLISYEYKFMYNNGTGWSGNNVTTPPWDINNPVIYNNITQATDFRVKVREYNGCPNSNWSPTITVPVNITPITGTIWHN